MTDYRTFRAPVEGGLLHGGVWNPQNESGPAVLAIHGITASHLTWPFLARQVGGARVIAPDLRGRARSNALPGPYGLTRHADDLARLLDHLDVDRVVAVGHSMGAFVAVLLAHQHPERVASLVLVDGGLPIPRPADGDPAALLGPAADRLSRTFSSSAEYEEFWKSHPAFRNDWSPEMAAYAAYDLDGEAPALRPSTRVPAMAENVLQLNGSDGYAEALAELATPIDFLRAPRGLLDEPDGLYDQDDVDEYAAALPSLTVHEVENVNHYTIVLSDHGSSSVAAVVRPRLDTAQHRNRSSAHPRQEPAS